jgi:hypothetical protein
MLNSFTWTVDIMLVHVKAMQANVMPGFGRKWDSSTQERNFERNRAVRQAHDNLYSRLPVAR